MNNVIIRNSKISDSSSVYQLLCIIADLHKNGRPDMFPNLISKYTPTEVGDRLSKNDNGVFVAEVDGEVKGYVFCDVVEEASGKTLYIDDLCVDPSSRRLGIGRMLVNKAKEYAKDKDCNCLLLNVWEFNENALHFYEDYGFLTRSRHMELKL